MQITREASTSTSSESVTSTESNIGNVTALKTAPTILSNPFTPELGSEQESMPDSMLSEPSLFSKVEEGAVDNKTNDGIKSVNYTSNKYSNKTKAKVHFGACSIGALTFGILAGPVGLVFAPAYLNAVCMAMYGGNEFLVGDNSPHQMSPDSSTPEPDQPDTSEPYTPPNQPNLDLPEGETDDVQDDPHKKDFPSGRDRFDSKGGNFTFAPVNVNYAPNITINGNIYFQQTGEASKASQADSTEDTCITPDSVYTQPVIPSTNQVSVTSIIKMTSEQVSTFLDASDDEVDDQVAQTLVEGERDAHHITFNDGTQAIMTGLALPVPSMHHRGKGFSAFNETSLKVSEESFKKEKAQEKLINVGETHSWSMKDKGQWVLEPILRTDTYNLKPVIASFHQANTPQSEQSNGEKVKNTFANSSQWIREGNRWALNSDLKQVEDARVILSPGSAQAISSIHSNRTAGHFNNMPNIGPKKVENGKYIEKPMYSKVNVYKAKITNPAELQSVQDADSYSSLGQGNARTIHSQRGTRNADQAAKFDFQQAKKTIIDSLNDAVLKKTSNNSSRWVREGSRWIENPELNYGEGAPAILSSGSAQVVSGLHSNRSVGIFNNMSTFPLKNSENHMRGEVLENHRRLHIIGHRACPVVDTRNLVADVTTS